MLYISRFEFPDVETETDFRFGLKMTCYDSIYPFGVLSRKGLTQLDFEDITLLCGGNGTGKTTALNIIAEKLKLTRASLYNRSCFFERYLEDCSFICELEITPHSRIITSDDVFDFMLDLRSLSAGVVVSVSFQQVNGSPDAEACAKGNNQSLENTDSRVEKFHICVAGIIGC